MNTNNRISDLIEYLSLILVLSFFILHNVILVIIGIIFSIYVMNKNIINNFTKYIINKKNNTKDIKLNPLIREEFKELDHKNKENVVSLVDTIEELGFIPSKDKDDISNVA